MTPVAIAATWAAFERQAGLLETGARGVELGVAITAVLLAVLVGAGVLAVPRLGPGGTGAVVGLGLFGALCVASMAWSISPAASRDEALKAFTYAIAIVCGAVLAGTTARPFRALAIGIVPVTAALCGWALVARGIGAWSGWTSRLDGTIGHPNALAMVALALLCCSVVMAAADDRRSRLLGGALAGLATLALVLSGSRTGLAFALVAVALVIAVSDRRPLVRLVPVAAIAPAVVAGLWASTWAVFAVFDQLHYPRDLWILPLTVAAIGSGAVIADEGVRRLAGVDPRHERIALALVALAILAAAVIAVTALAGHDAEAGVGHLSSTSTNGRSHWWHTAWRAFLGRPLAGYGAGTFSIVEQVLNTHSQSVLSPHSIVLQALAGTGTLGGLLILGAGVCLLASAGRGVGRQRDPERAYAAAVGVGAAALLVHALFEIDWDVLAHAVVAAAVLGALCRRGDADSRLLPRVAGAVGGLVVAGAVGLVAATTWLASTRVPSLELGASAPARALADARSAQRLDPFSIAPLLAEADARVALGDRSGALAALERAVRREPKTADAWERLGTVQLGSPGGREAAIASFQRAALLARGSPRMAAALAQAEASP